MCFTSIPPYFRKVTHNTSRCHFGSTRPNWLLDSRASHHVNNDRSALSIHAIYDGTDELLIVYCISLPISHIGSMVLHTSNFCFVLSNVLYVPPISHNILCLSQLCHDNNISIIFFSSSFHVKDLPSNNL